MRNVRSLVVALAIVFSGCGDGSSDSFGSDSIAASTKDPCVQNAMTFDGVDDIVNIPDFALPGDFTIEAWVYLEPGISNVDGLVGPEDFGQDINFHAGFMRLFAPGDVVVANTPMQAQTWTHVAITRSGTSLALYLDGVLDANGTWGGIFTPRALGRGNAGFLDGALDEVRLWDVARSSAEISANYDRTVAPSSAGLVGYWQFGEAAGLQQVVDASGSGNDGSLGLDAGVSSDDPVRTSPGAPLLLPPQCGGGNDPPVATDDAAQVQESSSVAVDVLANDTDDFGLDPATVAVVDAPAFGVILGIDPGTGAITYQHDGSAATLDSFTYTVSDTEGLPSNTATVTVTIAANQPPIASADTVNVVRGASADVDVLANDNDDFGLDPATVTVVDAPAFGTIVGIDPATGVITYQHDGSDGPSDSFTYIVNDLGGLPSAITTVSVSVDDPVCRQNAMSFDGVDDIVNIPDFALPGDFTIEAWVYLDPGISSLDAIVGPEDFGQDINFHAGFARLFAPGDVVVANTPMQAQTWTHVAITRSGTSLALYLDGALDATGTWNGIFTPRALGRGNAGFLDGALDEVRLWDIARSSAEISDNYDRTVAPSSAGLLGYWQFDEADGIQSVVDASGSGNDGSLGLDTGVSSDDPVRTSPGAPLPVPPQCGGGNDPPVATNDAAQSQSGGSVAVDVLANDTDDFGLDPATVTVVDAPAFGTILGIDPGTGAITYQHDGSAATLDSFTYTVDDTEGQPSNPATVTVTIAANQPPIASADAVNVVRGASADVDVLANDNDDFGLDPATVTVVDAPAFGTIVGIDPATGVITYQHDGSDETSDSFTYVVNDLGGLPSAITTVSVSIDDPTCRQNAMSFDGVDDIVNIPDFALPGDFTIEAWVYLDPGISSLDAIVGPEDFGQDINFHAGLVRLFAPGDVVVANTPMQAQTWTHVAITRSGTSLALYLDGALDATGTWNGVFTPRALGRGNAGFLDGALDEVRLWDIARSSAEISASYDQTVSPSSAGLLGYWQFDEADGLQSVVDASGSGNDGTLGTDGSASSNDPSRFAPGAPIPVPPLCAAGVLSQPDPLSSGFVALGSGAVTEAVTITNDSPDTNITLYTVSAPADFSTDLSTPTTLAPGQSVTFNVSFEPTSAGTIQGEIEIEHTGAESPLTIPVAGQGVPSGVPVPNVFVTVDPGGTLADSTSTTVGSFSVFNSSLDGLRVDRLEIDLSTGLFPDLVFDPTGVAGDALALGFTVSSSSGVNVVSHTFLDPRDDGFDRLEVVFNDFDPGEIVEFSVDVDPTSIRGVGPPPSGTGPITQIVSPDGDGQGNLVTEPGGVFYNARNGNVTFANCTGDTVYRLAPNGVLSLLMGPDGDGQGNTPRCLVGTAEDSLGNVYAASLFSDLVFKIDPSGAVSVIMDSTGDGTNPLSGPFAIRIDDADNLFISSLGAAVFKVEPSGVISQVIGPNFDGQGGYLGAILGIALDDAGNLYVGGTETQNVLKVTPSGVITEIIDGSGDGSNLLQNPQAVAVDAAGNVYAAGEGSDNVFKVTPGGVVTQIAGPDGDGQGNPLDSPRGLAVTADGTVYAVGYLSENVLQIEPSGTITEILDSTGDGTNPFRLPIDDPIDLDPAGNVYVAGNTSGNLFRVEPSGAPPWNPSGAVSGLELNGAGIVVDFDDGTSLSSRLSQLAESVSGSEAVLRESAPPAPSLEILGEPLLPASTANPSQTLRITGSPGATVRVLQVEGRLSLENTPSGGFDLDPFEANEAIAILELSVTLDGSGSADVPVTLTRTDGSSGINVFVASEVDPADSVRKTLSGPITIELTPP